MFNCSEMSKMEVDRAIYENYDFVYDISMKPLDKARTIEARRFEMEFVRKIMVYEKVPRSQAAGHKVITTRLLDVDKEIKSCQITAPGWSDGSSTLTTVSTSSRRPLLSSCWGCCARSAHPTGGARGHTEC